MDLFADDLPDPRVGDRPVAEPGQTPPPARAPHTSDRLQLGDWDVPRSPPRASRRWLLLAATAPWAVVAAIVATSARSPVPDPAPPTADQPPTAPGPATRSPSAPPGSGGPDATAPSPGTSSTRAIPGQPTRPASPVAPDTRGEAVGLAAVVARSWLSTRPDGASIEGLQPSPGADSRYVEHLVVESVDHPARGALVVTVRAVVLPVEGDTYGPGRQFRLAVPISLDADAARPAGQPWPLAVEDVAVQAPTTAPVDDPDLQMAATEAVMAAGYRRVALVSLQRTSGWAWVATVEARAPGQDQMATHALWLRTDVGRLTVAGAPTPAPSDPRTAAPRSTSPPPSPSPDGSGVAP